MTWPLALGLARDVPGDLGDALLNMWILGWSAEHLPRVVTGQMSLHDFWNANIFHPEPLALSFSEHLFGQVLQILPVYHLTGNLILSYNLLFLSTFALSGLGMYLLVRELLGEAPGFSRAALVAGLIYAFIPMRIAQVAHIQSLSSQWMPLALYGFRRFLFPTATVVRSGFSRADLRPLAGGTAALLMQNWSCGYYLIYFAPFLLLFVLHQMFASRRARDWHVWASLAVAAAVVMAGTWPFLSLYLEAQRVHGFERSIGEVSRFSADVYSYFTAPEALRLWGPVMQAYPKPEGELFFGLLPMLLVLVGVAAAAAGKRGALQTHFGVAAKVLLAILVVQVAGLIAILVTGGFITSIGGVPIRATNPARLVSGMAVVSIVLLATSAAARLKLRRAVRSPLTPVIVLMLLGVWLSLGPMPQSRGRPLPGLGLYGVLYDHVPGFDGLRAPARYAMVAAVFLTIAAGYGVAAVLRRATRPTMVAAALGAMFVIEAAFVPMSLNLTWGEGSVLPPARVEPAATAPAVYRQLASMPEARVIVEFPFGDPAWELRSVYYSTVHWKRLVNGYSGGFPHGYGVRVARLQRVAENPDQAWQSVIDADATHVVVHEAAYPPGGAEPVKQWLADHGTHEVGRFGTDVLFAR